MADESLMRTARISLGMSMSDVAKEIGVSPQEISAWELGTRTPCTDKLMPIAHTLDIRMSDLIRDLIAIKKERK